VPALCILYFPYIADLDQALGLTNRWGKETYEKVFKMSKSGPLTYFREVKQEGQKVTWPSRKETIASTIAVFIMVTLAAIFLYLSDQVLAWLVSLILGIGVQ